MGYFFLPPAGSRKAIVTAGKAQALLDVPNYLPIAFGSEAGLIAFEKAFSDLLSSLPPDVAAEQLREQFFKFLGARQEKQREELTGWLHTLADLQEMVRGVLLQASFENMERQAHLARPQLDPEKKN